MTRVVTDRQGFRPCILIPTYNNPLTIARVVHDAKAYLPDVLIVDDGSTDDTAVIVDGLARRGSARVCRRERNGGKGAAVMTGFRLAQELGYTHALQIDADGQHDIQCVPAFLDAAREDPRALVAGHPVFDATVPSSRLQGRKITNFWVNVETGGPVIRDAMTGFRVYPIKPALMTGTTGKRMEFDIELAVRMIWAGTRVVNLPVGVRYLRPEDGGVSHFRMVKDNARISWLHTRLVAVALWRWLARCFA